MFGHSESRWDQIAAANVLDLHVTDGRRAEELGRINQQVKNKFRKAVGKSPESNSLQPWLNRFSKRFPVVEAKK